MTAHDVSTALTRTVLGIDRYYRASKTAGTDTLDREGLVPVHWSPLAPEAVDGWGDALGRLRRLLDAASTLPTPYERDWLSEQLLALTVLVRWLAGGAVAAEPLSYEQVVAGTLRIDPRPPTALALRGARTLRDAAVVDAGFGGYADYLEAERVAPDAVAGLLGELIGEARRRTEQRLPSVQLPADVIGVRAVSGTAFSAYCDYPGRAVWINTDVPYTAATLKQLAAHEAYPGHDAHMGHRDALVRAGRALPDTALVITNTAGSVLFEGIAERGLDLLEWRDDPLDRIAWSQGRLEWLASIEVAHGLNTGRLTTDEARRLLRDLCDGDEAWIDGKLRFVTHGLRAPFVYTYWWGGAVVGRWWRGVRAARRDRAIGNLYDRMHSPATLLTHADEEASNDAL